MASQLNTLVAFYDYKFYIIVLLQVKHADVIAFFETIESSHIQLTRCNIKLT